MGEGLFVRKPEDGGAEGRRVDRVCALGRNAACSWWRKLVGEIAKGGQAVGKKR
jgi:hypothetical protein